MSVSYTAVSNLDDINGSRIGSEPSTMIRDWRRQLRTPPTYRLGNRTFRIHYHIALLCICFGALILIFLFSKHKSQSSYSNKRKWYVQYEAPAIIKQLEYNYTYPLTPAIIDNGIQTYRIGLIADLDKDSKSKQESIIWRSYLKMGHLSYNPTDNSVQITFNDDEPPTEFTGSYSLKGRGMELSELVTFNGRMLTFDDRTGLVFELKENKALPWVLLMDGLGNTGKGFKSEWATVKDEVLYVGSMGKEWTTSAGDFVSFDPMYVKAVTMTGEVRFRLFDQRISQDFNVFNHLRYFELASDFQVHHLNWIENYQALRTALGIEWPGYLLHESASWSPINRKWYFLPRRCSKERYNETKVSPVTICVCNFRFYFNIFWFFASFQDELMGCNKLISADENFRKVEAVTLPPYKPTFGFSSFKFVPGSNDNVIVALLSEEYNGKTATHVTAFTVDGKILLAPFKINTDFKYEGIEFF